MSCVLGSRFALPKRNALVGDRSNRASRSIGHPTKRMIHIVVPAGNLFGIVNQPIVADSAARMRTCDHQLSGGARASCRPELSCPHRERMSPDYSPADARLTLVSGKGLYVSVDLGCSGLIK